MARRKMGQFLVGQEKTCKNMTSEKVEEMLMTETFYYPSGKGFVIRT